MSGVTTASMGLDAEIAFREQELTWPCSVQKELVRLVELLEFDFEAAAKQLRRAIAREDIPVKASTRNLVSKFTEDACREHFFLLDSEEIPYTEEDVVCGKENFSKPECDLEHEDDTAQLVNQRSTDIIPGEEVEYKVEEVLKARDLPVELELDLLTEAALFSLHDSELQVATNQEESEQMVSELGEVIQLLESQTTIRSTVKDEEGFNSFSAAVEELESTLAPLNLPHPSLPMPAPENMSNELPTSKPALKRPVKPHTATVVQSASSLGKITRRLGTRDEVYTHADSGSESDASQADENDWKSARARIKSGAALGARAISDKTA